MFGTMDSCGPKGPFRAKYEYNISDFECGVSLDSLYQIIPYYYKNDPGNMNLYYDEYSSSGTGPAFPPPPKAFALQNNPSIVGPQNHRVGIGTDNVLLRWHQLALMDKYHLQVSLDSLFKSAQNAHPQIQNLNTIVDTNVVDTQFTLPPLSKNTKYFWRIVGVNSEGETRWSDVWNFTTGVTAGIVKTEAAPFSFSAFPNPASDKLNITYSLSQGPIIISLYNILGVRVRTLTLHDSEPNEVEMPLGGLPAGSYVLELSDEKTHISMPISIIR